jgi:hypothetical protein
MSSLSGRSLAATILSDNILSWAVFRPAQGRYVGRKNNDASTVPFRDGMSVVVKDA